MCFSIILLLQGLPLALSPFHSLPTGKAGSRSVLEGSRCQPSSGRRRRLGVGVGALSSQIGKEQTPLSSSAWSAPVSLTLHSGSRGPLGFLGLLTSQDREAELGLLHRDPGPPPGLKTLDVAVLQPGWMLESLGTHAQIPPQAIGSESLGVRA